MASVESTGSCGPSNAPALNNKENAQSEVEQPLNGAEQHVLKENAQPEVEQPLNGAEQNVFINVKVNGLEDGRELFFKIKTTQTLHKLMNCYCDYMSVNPCSIVFLFGGRHLRGDQTPGELEMADGGEIDSITHSIGGNACYRY